MILHIFTQVSEYSNEFVRLLCEEFDPGDHVIIYRKQPRSGKIPDSANIQIYYIESRHDLITKMPQLLKDTKKIIFHSFPVSRSLFFWYRYRKFMNKAAWFIWGHDAYWFRYCKKTPGNFIYEYIRRQLIHELGTLISPIKGDYEYVKAHYNTKGVYVNCRYPVPTNFELLKSLRRQNASKDAINVQIGNSANPTNNLEEMINFFGEFNNIDNYRFYCLLSYGDHEYAEKISQLGNKVLGKRFKPVINFMDRTEYANYIASIDILIMNHNRQQGLGNILSFLYLGKKVYLRSDNSLYAFFKENGIRVFNTLDLLKSRNLEEMVVIDAETINENREKTERLVARDQIAKQWMQVFN